MILLWGVPSDPPLAAVEAILRRDRVPYAFLDQRAVLDSEISLAVSDVVTGMLRVHDEALPLEGITAVYPRPLPLEQIGFNGDIGAFHQATAFHQLFSIWLDLTPAKVLNRPQDMALNYSKPYQASMIKAAGFAVPETLLTTESDAVRAFQDRPGGVIYKSISAVRSIVARLKPEDAVRLEGVVWCPTQFQQRIVGNDVRVHVVGDDVFACEIISTADDYRYAPLSGDTLEIRALPSAGWLDRCRALSAAMGYVIAGIDLRCENEIWYCFEVNPSPGFTYYQERTGQPIDEAIANLLRG